MIAAILFSALGAGAVLVMAFWLAWRRLPPEPQTSYDHGIPRPTTPPEAQPRKAA